MQVVFIDIDNTLLDFDAYIRQTCGRASPTSA